MVFLSADLAEAVDVGVRWNMNFTAVGEICGLFVVGAVATHFCLNHDCSMSRDEGGDVVFFFAIIKVLEPSYYALVSIKTIAERPVFQFVVSDALRLCAIHAETVNDGGIFVSEGISVFTLDAKSCC